MSAIFLFYFQLHFSFIMGRSGLVGLGYSIRVSAMVYSQCSRQKNFVFCKNFHKR